MEEEKTKQSCCFRWRVKKKEKFPVSVVGIEVPRMQKLRSTLKKKILSKVLSGLKTWNRSERSLHAAPAMTTIPVYSVLYQRSRMLADF